MYQQLLVDRILARVRYTYRCIVDVPYWQLLMTTAALYSCTIDTAVVWQQLYCMAIRILSIVWLLVATVLVWLQPHCNSCMTAIRQCSCTVLRQLPRYIVLHGHCTRSSQIQLDLDLLVASYMYSCTTAVLVQILPGIPTWYGYMYMYCLLYLLKGSCRYLKNIRNKEGILQQEFLLPLSINNRLPLTLLQGGFQEGVNPISCRKW